MFWHTRDVAEHDPYHQFFEAPRLPPLPSKHTEVVVSSRTRLYEPKPSSSTFKPRRQNLFLRLKLPLPHVKLNDRDCIQCKTRRSTTIKSPRRPASWVPLSKSAVHSYPSATSRSKPPRYLSNLPSSHRKINVFPQEKRWGCDTGIPPLAPIPLSHGSGEVEGRIERYREMIQCNERRAQDVVEGLGRREDPRAQTPDLDGGSNGGAGQNAQVSTTPQADLCASTSAPDSTSCRLSPAAGPSRVFRHRRPPFYHPDQSPNQPASRINEATPHLPRLSRKCTNIASQNKAADCSQQEEAQVPTASRVSPEAANTDQVSFGGAREFERMPHWHSEASLHPSPSTVDGFSTGWKSEEWKADWGVDRECVLSDHDVLCALAWNPCLQLSSI